MLSEEEVNKNHEIISEMLQQINNYAKERKITLWYNINEIYELELKCSPNQLSKIKLEVEKQLSSLPECCYCTIGYRLEFAKERGEIVPCIVENLRKSSIHTMPPEKILQYKPTIEWEEIDGKKLPREENLGEVYIVNEEEAKEDRLENEFRKIIQFIGLQEDLEI